MAVEAQDSVAATCESERPGAGDTLVAAALKVLNVGDPWQKASFTEIVAELWATRQISEVRTGDEAPCRSRPARDYTNMTVVEPGKAPRLGKGGSLASRQAIIHSLAHIENWAVDLSWDIIARFGADDSYDLPESFFDDWVRVAADEGRHFSLLARRLEAIGSHYGAIAVHDGLWESATRTAGSLPARLAVEHCVHEARGLDVLPQTVNRLRNGGDAESADILEKVIYEEEITHCAAGVRWLRHLHAAAQEAAEEQQHEEQPSAGGGTRPDWKKEACLHETTEEWFHQLIRDNFRGSLKPPFNDAARAKAGFGPEWYLPLAQ